MDGKVVIGSELDTKGFDKEIVLLEDKLNDIKTTLKMADKDKTLFSTREIKEMEAEAQKLGRKIDTLKQKQSKINGATFNRMKDSIENVGKSVQNVTKKVVKWGLAIFGIGSAYALVRNAISTITNEDEQLKADIDYMKNAIAYTLEPLVRGIVNLAKQLMFYVGYIVKAWTGKNIFANANKSLKNSVNSAKALNKELQKTTASFDEMNVLQDTSSSGGDTGGGITTPSFDLTGMDIEVPSWLQWIVDHKDEVIAGLAGIAGGILAINLGASALMGLGIGLLIGGIIFSIMSLIEYLNDPSWENFGKIIQGIGIVLLGLAIIIGSVPLAVAGAVVLIVGTIIKYWDKIKAFLQKGIDWLTDKSDWIRKHLGNQVGDIYDNIVSALKLIIIGFNNVFNGIKNIFDGIIKLITGVFTGDWEKAWKGVQQIFSGIFQGLLGLAQIVLGKILGIAGSIALAVGQTIADIFKSIVNGVLKTIESVLNAPIKTVNKLIGVINKVPGINLGTLPTFNLPRLAKGGIINQPGRGVYTGSAIAGEAGKEFYMPLQDEQMLSMVGQAIGKYITINANITNTMNGRVISRELQKIQNENDFAFNR